MVAFITLQSSEYNAGTVCINIMFIQQDPTYNITLNFILHYTRTISFLSLVRQFAFGKFFQWKN